MNRLKEKLNSQKGASILIALLFLLICAMVASSVLMASVANAGKQRSNEEEEQVYLALSSAVKLVCDDITSCEYKGKIHCFREWYNTQKKDEYGNIIWRKRFHLERESGIYCKINNEKENGFLSSILLQDLDILYAKDMFDVYGYGRVDFVPWYRINNQVIKPHEIILKLNTGNKEIDDKEIKLTLKVETSYAIYVHAELGDYEIDAEILPIKSKVGVPSEAIAIDMIEFNNGKWDYIAAARDAMTWKIGYITQGGGIN